MNGKIVAFTDLVAWKEGHKLALLGYPVTNEFARTAFVLADQIRKCFISITSNVAEGFSRRTNKDKMQFYYIALGSITELQSQLLLVRDLKYMTSEKFTELTDQTYYVHKLIFGLIKHSRNFT